MVPGCVGGPRRYAGCDLGLAALTIQHGEEKNAKSFSTCRGSLPVAPSGVEGYRLALYEWALIVLPFFLESSELSLELADYLGDLGRSTFSMVSVRFPYLMRLAKVAISKYSMRVS